MKKKSCFPLYIGIISIKYCFPFKTWNEKYCNVKSILSVFRSILISLWCLSFSISKLICFNLTIKKMLTSVPFFFSFNNRLTCRHTPNKIQIVLSNVDHVFSLFSFLGLYTILIYVTYINKYIYYVLLKIPENCYRIVYSHFQL